MELIDGEGRPTSFGRTGEPLSFRLNYATYHTLENVVVGIAVDHQNGQHISGTNSRRHGRTLPILDGTGYVDYHIRPRPAGRDLNSPRRSKTGPSHMTMTTGCTG